MTRTVPESLQSRQNSITFIRAAVLISVLAGAANVQAQRPAGWSMTGALAGGHGVQTATLLKNGKVLVVGSVGDAELYDPESGQWRSTGNLITPRFGHIAVRLSNGKVLVAGGYGKNGGVLTSAEIYDPATGVWCPAGNLSVPRAAHTANLLADGGVLVIGGEVVQEILGQRVKHLTYSSAELYDPATGVWSSGGTMPSPHAHHASTVLANGNVLVIGGDDDHLTQRRAALFDLATRTWTATGDLTTGRWEPRATLLPDARVLVTGGYAENGSDTAELYDPDTGQWSATGSMTAPRLGHTATLLPGGKVLVAGGHLGDEDYYTLNVTVLDTSELYDPVTGLWSATSSMNVIRYGHTATLLTNGRVLVTGGFVNGGNLNTAEVYDAGSALLTLNSTCYRIGDSWTMRVNSFAPNAWIRLVGTTNGKSWGIPNWRRTDDYGNFSETGTFSFGTEGLHTLVVDIGGGVSNEVTFRVETRQMWAIPNSN